jgi:hypothetical protein
MPFEISKLRAKIFGDPGRTPAVSQELAALEEAEKAHPAAPEKVLTTNEAMQTIGLGALGLVGIALVALGGVFSWIGIAWAVISAILILVMHRAEIWEAVRSRHFSRHLILPAAVALAVPILTLLVANKDVVLAFGRPAISPSSSSALTVSNTGPRVAPASSTLAASSEAPAASSSPPSSSSPTASSAPPPAPKLPPQPTAPAPVSARLDIVPLPAFKQADDLYQFPVQVTNFGDITATHSVYRLDQKYIEEGEVFNAGQFIDTAERQIKDQVKGVKRSGESPVEWPPRKPAIISNPNAKFTQSQIDSVSQGKGTVYSLLVIAYDDGSDQNKINIFYAEMFVNSTDLNGGVQQISDHNYDKHRSLSLSVR